eukprot:comp4739_c0_seq1/m.888 comp4739_c0_seq1/g.888  ORF comp4739_c0_seq1/g.888 comp4739_c0_seq1/m.888 type:complete len:474 (-) comp4739_c0_seq1:163-1584(-)
MDSDPAGIIAAGCCKNIEKEKPSTCTLPEKCMIELSHDSFTKTRGKHEVTAATKGVCVDQEVTFSEKKERGEQEAKAREGLRVDVRSPHRAGLLAIPVLLTLYVIVCVLLYFSYVRFADTLQRRTQFAKNGMHLLGLACFGGCVLSVLFLLSALAVYFTVRRRISARGRFPPSVLAIAAAGHFLMFYVNGCLLWTYNSDTFSESITSQKWFYLFTILLPTWTSRGFAVLPTTYLMLRVIVAYYGAPTISPPSWDLQSSMRHSTQQATRNLKQFLPYMAVMLLPMLICLVTETFGLAMADSLLEHLNGPVTHVLWLAQDFIHLFYGTIDLWCVFCLFLVRLELRALDLDITRVLVSLSVLYNLQVVLSSIKYGVASIGSQLWPHLLYVLLLYAHLFMLFSLFFVTLSAMVRGKHRRLSNPIRIDLAAAYTSSRMSQEGMPQSFKSVGGMAVKEQKSSARSMKTLTFGSSVVSEV